MKHRLLFPALALAAVALAAVAFAAPRVSVDALPGPVRPLAEAEGLRVESKVTVDALKLRVR